MIQPVDNDKGFVKKTKQRSARNNKQKLPHHKKVTKIKTAAQENIQNRNSQKFPQHKTEIKNN